MPDIGAYLKGEALRVADAILSSIYHVPFLDTALVALYFATMAWLFLFGAHRSWLVSLYYRRRRNAAAGPEKRFLHLPRVTVQLPLYNERFVVDQLLEAVSKIDYPRDLLDIQVLDDSADETQEVARAAVDRLAEAGHAISYHHRRHREGFKAGALREGMKKSRGELFAIFDADFLPGPDFLQRTVHYFTDPAVGLVQARWTYRNREYSLLTRIQAMLLDGHFVFEQGGRSRAGRFFNFNGTAGVLRRSMIESAGGWQHDTLTEDADLSYRAQMKGWKFVYVPQIEVLSELPTDMVSFQMQQARWAKGLTETGKKLLPALSRSRHPWAIKAEAWLHLTANLSYPMVMLLSLLLLPATLLRLDQWGGRLVLLDIPLFLGTFGSLATFYLLSQRELLGDRWTRAIFYIPAMIGVGVGLTLTNAKGVMEALAGRRSAFERTAKYTTDSQVASRARRTYRRRLGWTPIVNLAVAVFFAFTAVVTLAVGAWATFPFALLFTLGYGFAGGMTIIQRADHRLSESRLRTLALGDRPARTPAMPT